MTEVAASAVFGVPGLLLSAALLVEWWRQRRFDRHTALALSIANHPAHGRPRGPEDDPAVLHAIEVRARVLRDWHDTDGDGGLW